MKDIRGELPTRIEIEVDSGDYWANTIVIMELARRMLTTINPIETQLIYRWMLRICGSTQEWVMTYPIKRTFNKKNGSCPENIMGIPGIHALSPR